MKYVKCIDNRAAGDLEIEKKYLVTDSGTTYGVAWFRIDGIARILVQSRFVAQENRLNKNIKIL